MIRVSLLFCTMTTCFLLLLPSCVEPSTAPQPDGQPSTDRGPLPTEECGDHDALEQEPIRQQESTALVAIESSSDEQTIN